VSGIFWDPPDHADVDQVDDEPDGHVYGHRDDPPDGLSWRHLELYRVLATFADRDGRGARVKHATLAARMRPPVTPRHARRLMAGLYGAGWVVPHPQLVEANNRGRRRGANRYYLTRPLWTLPEPPKAQVATLGTGNAAGRPVRTWPEVPKAQVATLGHGTSCPNRTSSVTRSLK
jgi:hypothetical protein